MKLSKNSEVSPKKSEKACHSPYFQKGVEKSPLDFLRFPFSVAFSRKELMVPFWRCLSVLCQNDEVSLMCTPPMSREVVVRYPHRHPQTSCSWMTAPHLTQRGILIAPVLTRFTGDYD